jgi:hypothetical protein
MAQHKLTAAHLFSFTSLDYGPKGFTLIFLYASLAFYYFLIIVKQCHEKHLKQLVWWLLGPPLLLGFGLAFAAIPFVTNGILTCHMEAYRPFSEALWGVLLLFVVPLPPSMLVLLVLLTLNRSKGDDREICNTLNLSKSSRTQQSHSILWMQAWLERKVFGQCVFYAAAFLVTCWPVLIAAIFMASNFDTPFWFWVYTVVAVPMQGLTNAVC